MRGAYLRFCDGVAAVSRLAVMAFMAAMTLDCILGVFFRYVVQDALTWTGSSSWPTPEIGRSTACNLDY